MNTEIRSGLIFNTVIAVLVMVGVIVMIHSKANATGLTESGWANLKFYTVLSNIFAGVVALAQIIMYLKGRGYLKVLKLTSAAAVTLTFLVVAGFFGPLSGWIKLYKGSNLFFHLIVPLLCVIEFVFSGDDGKISLRDCVLASLSTLVYGSVYLINILINGKGVWPESNDWYGFLNWGYPVGIAIFAGVVLMNWGIACLFWLIKRYVK